MAEAMNAVKGQQGQKEVSKAGCAQCPIPSCTNGCTGRGEIELFEGKAIACKPVNGSFIAQPRQAFPYAVELSTLPCQQAPKDGAAELQVGEGRTKTFMRSRVK